MLIRPGCLSPGDTVGIVAPASPPPDPESIDRAIPCLRKFGFQVKVGRHARKRHGFLAGTDSQRAGDLMDFFADPKVRAIVCLRGGYGSTRLLPLLDYNCIRKNPKIFVGYSDITSLHCALLIKARLISFHGPMLNSELSSDRLPDFTLQSFLNTLTQVRPPGSIRAGYADRTVSIVRPGVAVGPLIGGNLSLLCSLVGTPYQPPFRDRILFFEDLGEAPYRFDRMLTQLLNCGLLQQVAGIAIGLNRDCADARANQSREYRQSLADVFTERLRPLKVPVVAGLPFGHVPFHATIPLGVRAKLDGIKGDLIIDEAAVC